jgi:hypothetical protein
MSQCSRVFLLFLTVCLSALLPWQSAIAAQPQYTLLDLGPGATVIALDRDSGVPVGALAGIGARRFGDDPLTLPPGFRPSGILAKRIIGAAHGGDRTSPAQHAFVFEDGVLTNLGAESHLDTGHWSWARTLNSREICGSTQRHDIWPGTVPGCWVGVGGVFGVFQEWPSLARVVGSDSWIAAINESGTAVGYSIGPGGGCVFWPDGSAGGAVPCGAGTGEPEAINGWGIFVGTGFTQDSTRGYVRLPEGVAFLPPLPGDTSTHATSINDAGAIGGTSCHTEGGIFQRVEVCQAVLWDSDTPAHAPVSLLALVQGREGAGWLFTDVVGISNTGVIAVLGTLHGEPRSAILRLRTPGKPGRTR